MSASDDPTGADPGEPGHAPSSGNAGGASASQTLGSDQATLERKDAEGWLPALGRGVGRLASRVGRGVAKAYLAVDPDLRRHVALMPVVGLTQLVGGDVLVVPRTSPGRRVLLFVHGLGGHPGNFVGFRTWLRLRGHTAHYAFPLLPPGTDGGLEEMGSRLGALIEEICRINGLENAPDGPHIAIVAHSMGGIVTRIALTDPGTAVRVAQVVTFGTPHRGTWAARFADTTSTRALRPGSPVLARLDAQVPWPASLPPLTAFWSNADMLLLPHDTAALPGARNVEVAGASHYGYLFRRELWQQALDAAEARTIA